MSDCARSAWVGADLDCVTVGWASPERLVRTAAPTAYHPGERADHVRLKELLRQLEVTPPAAHRPTLLDLYRLVFPHAFAEESVLWQVPRRVLPEGKELTL